MLAMSFQKSQGKRLTDWYADVVGNETLVVEASCDSVPAVEEDDDGEKDTSHPS